MVVNRRKKVGKYRAHVTHGGGHRKKRRGAGSRGGRGRAGTGKRAGHKKAGIRTKLGSCGFTSKSRNAKIKAVNLGHFTNNYVTKLVSSGKAVKEGDIYSINLVKLGFHKLLGTGKSDVTLKITVNQCSARAAEKIKAAGGEVVFVKKGEDKTSNKVEKEETSSKTTSLEAEAEA